MRIISTYAHDGLHAGVGAGLTASPWLLGLADSIGGIDLALGLLNLVIVAFVHTALRAWHAPPLDQMGQRDPASGDVWTN